MKTLMNQRGQGLTEYVIILVAVVALAFFLINKNFSQPMKAQITAVGTQLSQPANN